MVWYGSRQHAVRCGVVWWPSLLVCLCVCVTENDRSARHNTIRNDIQRRDPLNIACSRCSMVYMLFRGIVSYMWCGQILCFGLVFSNRAILYGVLCTRWQSRGAPSRNGPTSIWGSPGQIWMAEPSFRMMRMVGQKKQIYDSAPKMIVVWVVTLSWLLTTFSQTDHPPTHTYNRFVWDWTLLTEKHPNSDHILCDPYPLQLPLPWQITTSWVFNMKPVIPMFRFCPLFNRYYIQVWHKHWCWIQWHLHMYLYREPTYLWVIVLYTYQPGTHLWVSRFSAEEPFIGVDKQLTERWSLTSQATPLQCSCTNTVNRLALLILSTVYYQLVVILILCEIDIVHTH